MNNATTVYWAEIQGLTQLAGIGIPEKRIRKLETQLETQDNSGIHSSELMPFFALLMTHQDWHFGLTFTA